MELKLLKWNVPDHLQSDEDIIAYINACLDEADPALVVAALGHVAQAKGISAPPNEAGSTNEDIYGSLSRQRDLYLFGVMRALNSLGLTLRVARPKRIEFLSQS